MSRFIEDTAIERIGDGCYSATMDRGWWIVLGPNGGYVAAVVARAITAEVSAGAAAADAPKTIRSLTLHYLKPPSEGPVRIEVTVERRGRSVATVTARMFQDDVLMVIAIAAVTCPRDGYEFNELVAPTTPAPESLPELPPLEELIPMNGRYDLIPCVGSAGHGWPGSADWSPAVEPMPAVSGGWLRFSDPTPIDEIALVAIADAWFPPVFHRAPDRLLPVPTVDLTVHVHQLPADPLDWVLVRFESPLGVKGYLVENGEIWDRHGNLLAVCRQLAVAG